MKPPGRAENPDRSRPGDGITDGDAARRDSSIGALRSTADRRASAWPSDGESRDEAGRDTSPARRNFPLKLDQLKSMPKVPVGARSSIAPPMLATVALPAVRATPVTSAARAMLRPQAPLAHAAQQARRQAVPEGLGLDSAGFRARMVERLADLGIRAPAVLVAMGQVHRHLFVDAALVTQAYEDTSLPIGLGQTISKPSVVARMIELLVGGRSAHAQGGLGRVLEIGTGCGYQAAVLARLGRQVYSVERLKALHDRARESLATHGIDNLRLIYADGMRGHPPNAPYDSIISAAGGDAVPEAWLLQLSLGGRLVAPVRDDRGRQSLVVIDRTETGFERTIRESVQFVPLKSGVVR